MNQAEDREQGTKNMGFWSQRVGVFVFFPVSPHILMASVYLNPLEQGCQTHFIQGPVEGQWVWWGSTDLKAPNPPTLSAIFLPYKQDLEMKR